MKKSLVALAALAATGAFAQSTVTISGNIDMSYVSAKTAAGTNFSGIASGATSTSKIIFSGSEDLGGGLSAIFRANSTIVGDRGNTFQRNANPNLGTGAAATAATNQGLAFGDRDLYIGLKGGFGEVRAGRNQSISDDNNNATGHAGSVWTYFMANSASFGGINRAYSAAPQLGSLGRISDSVKYLSPVFNGFQVQALYGFGERINRASEGSVTEAQISYSAGPLAAAYSIGRVAAAANDSTTFGTLAQSSSQATLSEVAAGNKSDESRLMASYDLGVAKVNVGSYRQKVGTAGTDKAWHVTGTVPVNAWTFGATYMNLKGGDNAGSIKGYSVSARYDLSKRTNAYAFYRTMDKLSTQTSRPSAVYVGMNHAF